MLWGFYQSCHDFSRSASSNINTRLSTDQMSYFSPCFSPLSHTICYPPPLTSSPSQPRRTRTHDILQFWLPCFVHSMFLFHCCLCIIFALFGKPYILSPHPAPPSSHTSFRISVFLQQNFTASMLFLPRAFTAPSRNPLRALFCFFLALSFLTFLSSVSDVSSRSNTWPTALDLVFSAFQPQSHFHRAFSQPTALHGTPDELFQ